MLKLGALWIAVVVATSSPTVIPIPKPTSAAPLAIAVPKPTNHQQNYPATAKDNNSSFFVLVAKDHDAIEAIAAVIGVLAAIALAIVTGYLWGATKSLAVSTADLAAGAKDQSEEIRKAREIAELQLHVTSTGIGVTKAQTRAYVTLLPSNFTLPSIVGMAQIIPERPSVLLQFQNSGNSGAHVQNIRAEHIIGHGAPPDQPPFFGTATIHFVDQTISQNGVSEDREMRLAGIVPEKAIIDQLSAGALAIFFYGGINYTDIFGDEHVTVWCMRSERDGTYRYWGGQKYNYQT